ncbi:hypothetical protein D8Y22_19220 [Salinadaptatus halalkaliphilus]|uniref:Uncharacterized protein n=1 Tax=Salinadaptatus halalkaliphilus TaxID=2419781 RepID=A0A4S3TH24_9EURY|nr:hypothetical protein [Salinadaptatus halalkaliphilus]THE63294.1 hypothetical protein D8Y22_19220 [Salinadaptatus halalkaliphilus]
MDEDANEDGDAASTLSVAEFVTYCRTQAGLLSGQVQTMGDEANKLLADVDEQVTEIRSRLEQHREGGPGTASPSSTAGPNSDVLDVDELEALQDDLEKKQSLVEAKQARMEAFQELAAGYTDLAEELETAVDDGATAFERVVQFEADADAPAYFPERKTLVEAAAESDDDPSTPE